MNFQVGKKVVCVIGGPRCERRYPEKFPTTGEIYTVRGIHPDGDSILLVEIINALYPYRFGMSELHFRNDRFRPVDETFGEETVSRLEESLIEVEQTV